MSVYPHTGYRRHTKVCSAEFVLVTPIQGIDGTPKCILQSLAWET